MATWEPYFGELIADCGEFVGDWPPYPPLEIPTDCTQVDLLVCLPPPSGNLADVEDGSYPTMYSWSGRFWASPGVSVENGAEYTFHYDGGEVPQPSDSNTARPGMHAYLICYDATTTPPAPLSIMPAGMTVGSTGPARGAISTGHWSDWQTGIQQTYQPTDHRHTGRVAGGFTQHDNLDGAALVDAKADLDAHQVSAAAGSIFDNTLTAENDTIILASKTGPQPTTAGDYAGEVRLTQNVATFVGTGHENERSYDPAVFTGLNLGFDYYPPTLMVDYEAATSTIAGWADWTIDIGNVDTYTLGGHATVYRQYGATTAPLTGFTTVPTYRFQAFAEELVVEPVDVVALGWKAYGAGTAVGTFTPTISTTITDQQPITGAATLTLSDVGAVPTLSVVVYSDYQGPLVQPVTNFTVGTYPTDSEVEGNTLKAAASLDIRLTFWGIGAGDRMIGGVSTQLAPRVVYQNPRWRYWVPGPPPTPITGGRLHTVGGHFRSAGGAQINMMQQSGLGPWLPIEDL